MAFDAVDGETVCGEDAGVAAEAAGGVDNEGSGGVVDGLGDGFAAAFCPPVLRRAAGEIGADAAFFACLAQADALGVGKEVEAV